MRSPWARAAACSGSADQVFTMDRIGRSGSPEYAKSGKASGIARDVIISGGGSIQLDGNAENQLTRHLTKKFFSGAMSTCREVLGGLVIDQKSAYFSSRRRADLRSVQSFITSAGMVVSASKPEYICEMSDSERQTTELVFTDVNLRVSNVKNTSSRCPTDFHTVSKTTEICLADISKLDELVVISECDGLNVKCLSGDCIHCHKIHGYKNKEQSWTQSERDFDIHHLTIYGSDSSPEHQAFSNFARTFSRLISNGSDEIFCAVETNRCRK